MELEQGMGSRCSQTVKNMKESTRITLLTEKGSILHLRVMFSMANSKMVEQTGRELSPRLLGINFKATGLAISSTEREKRPGPMAQLMKDLTLMEINKALENSNGPTETHMKAGSRTISSTVSGPSNGRMAVSS
jgi:hypothetical protein